MYPNSHCSTKLTGSRCVDKGRCQLPKQRLTGAIVAALNAFQMAGEPTVNRAIANFVFQGQSLKWFWTRKLWS